jgi:NADP-dependent 3-hydroxy acid dehydrogenase YdfG
MTVYVVYVVYVANKIAITSLSEGIRIDIAAPVKVSCIHPALFAVKLTIR